jgi:hypothetical protein
MAVPPRLPSNAADRIRMRENATEPDDDLMIMSSRASTDFAVPIYAILRKLFRISSLGYCGLRFILGAALGTSIRRTLLARSPVTSTRQSPSTPGYVDGKPTLFERR